MTVMSHLDSESEQHLGRILLSSKEAHLNCLFINLFI